MNNKIKTATKRLINYYQKMSNSEMELLKNDINFITQLEVLGLLTQTLKERLRDEKKN